MPQQFFLTLGSRVRACRMLSIALSLFAFITLLGCESAVDTDGRQALSGNVSLNGAPIQDGSIRFEPVAGKTASGSTITDGQYTIPAAKGLKPGKYRVFINAVEPETEERSVDDLMNNPGPARKELIPAKYNTKSDVTVEITEAGPNEFDFPIDSK
ncbi:carboxypeptidase regulatory-like domain-containing protein [Bremerella alba]|uniref:Carboxypeptidase regulatory-like domain-containing protein n=1 Tax=Bremerella alba TaxID=980252 RepID=A0A7V9A8J5_9BACT|nr:carboxypeptidase regulatory-like domain-containing protein [Bremerella alba]MBA2116512.1 hypothetical protein [Bremerella alba]